MDVNRAESFLYSVPCLPTLDRRAGALPQQFATWGANLESIN